MSLPMYALTEMFKYFIFICILLALFDRTTFDHDDKQSTIDISSPQKSSAKDLVIIFNVSEFSLLRLVTPSINSVSH